MVFNYKGKHWVTFLVSAIKELMQGAVEAAILQRDSARCLCHLWFRKGVVFCIWKDFNECCQCLWEQRVCTGRGSWESACCFRIGGSEFALIERNVPPRLGFIHYPLFFRVWYIGMKVNVDTYMNDFFSFGAACCIQQEIFSCLGWMHKSVCLAFCPLPRRSLGFSEDVWFS